MDRLYLIRVDMERFLGPFTLKQLKDAYTRMEFGMQDEISGSLRQWVSFDDVEGIKRHYPELAQLVQSEMLSGWGLSSHTTHPLPSAKLKPSKRRRPNNYLWASLVLGAFLLFGLAGIVLYKQGELNEILTFLKDRNFYNAQSAFGTQYNPRFESYMDRNRESINQAMKKKKGLAQWLPYVRAVAFSRDGRWDGINSKKLRGKIEEPLPQDCSMAYWEQTWLNSRSQWSPFLEGTLLPRDEWALLLAYDPHWIAHRSPMTGWLIPGSYHEACMQMALKALQRQSSGTTPWEAKVFIARLRWQLGVINKQVLSEEFQMSGTLWGLSCVEESKDEAELKNCQSSLSLKQGWKDAFDRMVIKRRLHLMIKGDNSLDEGKLAVFEALTKEFAARAETSPWSYAEEVRLFQEIIQQKGNIRQVFQQRSSPLHFD